jgi:hypothetical protein
MKESSQGSYAILVGPFLSAPESGTVPLPPPHLPDKQGDSHEGRALVPLDLPFALLQNTHDPFENLDGFYKFREVGGVVDRCVSFPGSYELFVSYPLQDHPLVEQERGFLPVEFEDLLELLLIFSDPSQTRWLL